MPMTPSSAGGNGAPALLPPISKVSTSIGTPPILPAAGLAVQAPPVMSRFDELLNALCMEHEAALRRFGSERFQNLVNELLAMQRMIRDLEQTHQRAKCQYEEQIAKLKAQLRALNPHDKSDSVEMEPPDLTAHIEPATFTSIRSRSEDRREGSHHLQRLQPLTLPSKQGNVLVTLKRTIGTNVGVKELSFALDIPNVVCGMAFHPVHSNTIAMAAKTVCYVWDTRANGIVPLANADNASSDLYYRSVAYSPNGPFLVAGSEDHTVTLWRDGKFVRRLTGHASDVYSVKFAANGVFYSCSGDGTVRRWTINVDDLQVISDVAFQYAHGLTSLAVSPDGLSLAAGGIDKTVLVWRLDNTPGTELKLMHILQDGHEDAVYCVDFDPTADFRLISGSLDKTIRLWDLREERCLAILQGHTDFVLSALFMRDGLRVISGSKDRCVLLWDLSPCLNDSGQDGGPTMLKPIGCVASFSNSVTCLAIRGSVLATGSGDAKIKLWTISK